MTIRSDVAMQGIPADRATKHATAKLSAAFASRLEELQSAWMRRTGRRRLAQSIAHLDDRLLADIGRVPRTLDLQNGSPGAALLGRHMGGQQDGAWHRLAIGVFVTASVSNVECVL
jgi:hypothetical protein